MSAPSRPRPAGLRGISIPPKQAIPLALLVVLAAAQRVRRRQFLIATRVLRIENRLESTLSRFDP